MQYPGTQPVVPEIGPDHLAQAGVDEAKGQDTEDAHHCSVGMGQRQELTMLIVVADWRVDDLT